MIARERFEWDVVLADQNGGTKEVRFSAYWSPRRDFVTSDFVAAACAAETTRATGKGWIGVSATPVEA